MWVPKLRKASYSVYKHPSVSKFIIPVGHRGERSRIKYTEVQVAGCAVNNSILVPKVGVSGSTYKTGRFTPLSLKVG